MATLLIFVRHGESEGNKTGRFNGHSDFKLTEKGRQQAQKTAEYLDKYKIDRVYASDLARAFETAEIIAKTQNLDVIPDKSFREINGGDFEGLPYEELHNKFPEEFSTWRNDMGNCRCPNGESIRELSERVNQKVIEIAKNHKNETILIGTHATPIRTMKTIWEKKDVTSIMKFPFVKNASVTVVDYSNIDNPVIVEYDVAEHIGELATELPKSIY